MAWFCTQLYIGKDSLSRLAGVEEENFLPSFFEVFQQFQELSVQFLDKNLFLLVRLVHWTQCEPNGVLRWILSHFNSQSKWFPATSVKYLLLGSNQKLCGCFVSGKWTLILFYHHSEREYNNQRNISIWSLHLIVAELRLLFTTENKTNYFFQTSVRVTTVLEKQGIWMLIFASRGKHSQFP